MNIEAGYSYLYNKKISMDEEILEYKKKLESEKEEQPFWEKDCITVEEAAAYTGVGRTKIRELVVIKNSPFIVQKGTQYFIIRKKFENFIEQQTSI